MAIIAVRTGLERALWRVCAWVLGPAQRLVGCVACGLTGRLLSLLISKIRDAGKTGWLSSALTTIRFHGSPLHVGPGAADPSLEGQFYAPASC